MTIFLTYRWPGNIRELENTIQSLVVTSQSHEILPEDLPPFLCAAISNMVKKSTAILDAESGRTLKEVIGGLEKRVIQQTLDKYGFVNKASGVLGVNRTTLFRKMKS